MRRRNKNKSLFWYGVRARLLKFFGIFTSLFGGIMLITNTLVGILIIIVGIFLIAQGSSSEYDYKRRGGHILYND